MTDTVYGLSVKVEGALLGAMWHKLLIFIMLLQSGWVFAHTYQARVDVAEWHLEPGPLKCRLWQSVPRYGDAVFEVSAGGAQVFYVDAYRPVLKPGTAQLSIVAPEWRPDLQPRSIGETAVVPGRRPIVLDEDRANLLLAELEVGMFPSIKHHGWHDRHSVVADVSAVNFQSAYTGYTSCVASLYPASFDQVRDSTLHFEFDKWGIHGALKARLDLIAGYIQLDGSIRKIIVDGHTDSDGRRGYNWELSRLRAKAVKDYLEARGIDPDLIQMRYFGEGKPAKANTTASNKATNRRVYVQLERG